MQQLLALVWQAGFFHAPIISSMQEIILKVIYTTNADSINTIEKIYPGTKVVSDLQEIFNNEAIQLVIVATPNTSHFSITKEAILSNKHVVVDKPFTVTSDEAEELIGLAQKHNTVLSVYQNRRWDSDFRTVKKLVNSSLLGTLVECEIHMDRFRNYLKDRAWREDDIPGSGMLVRAELPRFILLGDKGSFIKYGMDVQEYDLKSGQTPLGKPDWG